MIGIVVGLIIVAAGVGMYLTALRGNYDTLRSARLNIELRNAMDLMINDIRRAGYVYFNTSVAPSTNPFMQTNTNINLVSTGCLLYAYDANGNSSVDSSDFFGFKQTGSAIAMRVGGSTNTGGCSVSNDGWEKITDDNTIIVDSLNFSLDYQCANVFTNTSELKSCSAGNTIYDTAKAGSSKTDLVEARQVTITLTGHHKSDNNLSMQLTQNIRVRNDRILTVP